MAGVRYVNRVIGRDGLARLYFRKAGMPSIPLNSPWPPEGEEDGSPLALEVEAILARAPPKPAKPAPNTLKAALRAYELESPDFKVLGDGTKYEYRLIMRELEDDFGALSLATFSPEYIMQLRAIWAKRGHRAAENRLLLLKHALTPAMVKDGVDRFALIPGVPRPADAGEPHRIWPEGVVHAAIARALKHGKVGLARSIALGRYAGARRGDIVKMTKAARRVPGRIAWLSGKRRVPVDIAEDPALTLILTQTSDHPRSMILAYNLAGVAYTESGLGLEIGKLIEELYGLRSSKDPAERAQAIDSADYNLHGLRHTFGVEAALAGCSDAEGAARMGHRSANSFATYRRQAEKIRLSANADIKVAALRERTANPDLQNALQNACKTAPVRQAKPRGKNAAKSAS